MEVIRFLEPQERLPDGIVPNDLRVGGIRVKPSPQLEIVLSAAGDTGKQQGLSRAFIFTKLNTLVISPWD